MPFSRKKFRFFFDLHKQTDTYKNFSPLDLPYGREIQVNLSFNWFILVFPSPCKIFRKEKDSLDHYYPVRKFSFSLFFRLRYAAIQTIARWYISRLTGRVANRILGDPGSRPVWFKWAFLSDLSYYIAYIKCGFSLTNVWLLRISLNCRLVIGKWIIFSRFVTLAFSFEYN